MTGAVPYHEALAGRTFWKDSWKVRPKAMASPTLFICVVSSALEPGNFSNAKRGICSHRNATFHVSMHRCHNQSERSPQEKAPEPADNRATACCLS